MNDISHLAPPRHPVRLVALMFGIIAAPIFWLGQMMLGYGVSAIVCYGGERPSLVEADGPLHGALLAFDIVAIVAALTGGGVSLACWFALRGEKGTGRAPFMAIWGIMSSLWFLGAIIFTTIASLTVPLCTG